jgi:acyl carrier protein
MSKDKFLRAVEEIVEADPGTLEGGMALTGITGWDSMAVLGFIAFADSECGVTVAPQSILTAKTLDDLYQLLTPATAG